MNSRKAVSGGHVEKELFGLEVLEEAFGVGFGDLRR